MIKRIRKRNSMAVRERAVSVGSFRASVPVFHSLYPRIYFPVRLISALKVEAACSSETVSPMYETVQRHIPENFNLKRIGSAI
jgi:hypothetical protein